MSQSSTSIRLPRELREELARHARRVHKSQTSVIVEALKRYLRQRDETAFQALIDEECERMNAADREDPDYQDYLEGDEDPWGR
ncbi:MAG: ribbon-helix-helix protein, CopG family [Gammaproteobacteria bacterium]